MTRQFKRSTSWDSARPAARGRDSVKITDLVEMWEWPKKGGSKVGRLIGPVAGRGIYKIKVRKKDGTETEINKAALNYDPTTDDLDTSIECPYSKLPADMARFSRVYFSNIIDRDAQDNAPAKQKPPTKAEAASGFKDIDSDTFTPARCIRIPSSLALRIQQLGKKNVVRSKNGDKKSFPASHEKYGFDLDMTFDGSLPPANMYSADPTESPTGERRSPLTEEEQNILLWDLDKVYEPEDLETAKKEAASLKQRWYGEDADEDEDDKPKRSRRKQMDDDEDDEDDLDLDMDDEPPARSSKKSSKPAPKKRRPADDEDDEDDEDDLDLDMGDEDEDEPPARSRKKPAKPTKKRRPADDEDDEDDDDLDLDDDEDEPPARKKRRPADDEAEDDDDLDLDDEDDEDDEPPARKKRAAKEAPRSSKKPSKPAPKKRRPADDDEDDDLDDLDDLDDDDDIPY